MVMLGRRSFFAAAAALFMTRSSPVVAILPDNQGRIINDIERRLRDLENAQRSPTGGTASAVLVGPVAPVLYDGVQRTTVLEGVSTVDLPSCTAIGAQFLVVATFEMSGYGDSGLFRGQYPVVTIEVDGTPPIGLVWPSPFNDLLSYEPTSLVCGVVTTPGTHTFQMTFSVEDGGGVATSLAWRNITLMVVPVAQQ